MTSLENQLRVALRARAEAMRVPDRPALDLQVVERDRRPRPRWAIVAACLALVVAGVVTLSLREADNPATVRSRGSSTTSTGPSPTVPGPGRNGWLALEGPDAGGILLVRPGEVPRQVAIGGSGTASDSCPAWSPDGTHLLIGRLTGGADATPGDAELVIVRVGRDGAAGAPTVVPLDGFETPSGFDPHPCGVWAPDGRWVALRGPGEVWVVDTQTGEIRRLRDLRPLDLDWRPGTDELAIAGETGFTRAAESQSAPVKIYTVSTGELRPFSSVTAGNVAWSPDGSTLAYTGTSDDDTDPLGIWLVDANGTNVRELVADAGRAVHGMGPVWSPTGDRIVYQRLCCSRAETHDVVLVDAADGAETVLPPLVDPGTDGTVRWYPFLVTWSPDGRTLLMSAWRSASKPVVGGVDGRGYVIAVPADSPNDITIVHLGGLGGFVSDHQWIQAWGRQPT